MSNGADLPHDVDALKAMLLEARASISQMQQDMRFQRLLLGGFMRTYFP
jgi:hypothetical protein